MDKRIIILTIVFPLVHQAFVLQFQDQLGFELLGASPAEEDMDRLASQVHPNLVIIDLDWVISKMTSHDSDQRCPSFPLLQRFHAVYPETRFMILANNPDAILIKYAYELGIGCFLLKDDKLTLHLPDVARTICDGGYAFSQAVMSVKNSLPEPRHEPQLTSRQIEILEAIVTYPNLSYQEQAQSLGITKHTLETHLRSIFQKLEVSNLTAAILTAVRLGMIPYHRLCSPIDITEAG